MKKLLLLIVAVAFYSVSNAQYKAVKGDWTTDFGLAGGISNTTVNPFNTGFSVDATHPLAGYVVKLRYFNSDKSAIRGMLMLNTSSKTDETTANVKIVEANSLFTLGVGYEKHFEGTDRLDPFIAGDVVFSQDAYKYDKTMTGYEKHTKTSNSLFGARISIGADYYFAKKVYLGAEVGLGLFKSVGGKYSATETNVADVDSDGLSYFKISPAMIGGLKIGYAF